MRHPQMLEQTLPRFIDGIVAVLTSPSGVQHTFSVSGREVNNIGPGDQHAALVDGGLQAHARRLEVAAADTTWTVTLYPTRRVRRRAAAAQQAQCARLTQPWTPPLPQLVEQYVTSRPRDNAIGIAAAVLACALLFWCALLLASHSRCMLACAVLDIC